MIPKQVCGKVKIMKMKASKQNERDYGTHKK